MSHPAARQDISKITVLHVAMRAGSTNAPLRGLVVSGRITNRGTTPLRCRATSFLLVDVQGNALLPRTQWCDAAMIAPRASSGFTASFAVEQPRDLQLRFEHGDGTYESHAL